MLAVYVYSYLFPIVSYLVVMVSVLSHVCLSSLIALASPLCYLFSLTAYLNSVPSMFVYARSVSGRKYLFIASRTLSLFSRVLSHLPPIFQHVQFSMLRHVPNLCSSIAHLLLFCELVDVRAYFCYLLCAMFALVMWYLLSCPILLSHCCCVCSSRSHLVSINAPRSSLIFQLHISGFMLTRLHLPLLSALCGLFSLDLNLCVVSFLSARLFLARFFASLS